MLALASVCSHLHMVVEQAELLFGSPPTAVSTWLRHYVGEGWLERAVLWELRGE